MRKKTPPRPPKARTIGGDKTDRVLSIILWIGYIFLCIALASVFYNNYYIMEENKPIHTKPNIYAFYFELIKEIGLKYGYNIVLHGSMNRDLDLITIPWEDKTGDVDKMIDEISFIIGGNVLMVNRSVKNIKGDRYSLKPHGRICYVVNINRDFEIKYNGMVTKIKEYADPQYYIDISVLPV